MKYLKWDEIDENTPILIENLKKSDLQMIVDSSVRKNFLVNHYGLSEQEKNRIVTYHDLGIKISTD
jgi:hypothetical protein